MRNKFNSTKELFDPGIDNLPMPVDGFEPNPHLEMLMQREQLMEDIDSIVEAYCMEMWKEKYPGERPWLAKTQQDLIFLLCDAVCRNFPAM